jgi:hypothetical protein
MSCESAPEGGENGWLTTRTVRDPFFFDLAAIEHAVSQRFDELFSRMLGRDGEARRGSKRAQPAQRLEPYEHGAGPHPQELGSVCPLAERGFGHEDGESLLAAGGVAPCDGDDATAERDREAPSWVRTA